MKLQGLRLIAAAGLGMLGTVTAPAAPTPQAVALTGPETEKRFPPLKVPGGFQATLFACDPLIEYPSAIALGPSAGSIYLAHDYMTGLGTEIVRRDEVRLVKDGDGDGYADSSTVHAGGFNSIEGLCYHAGTVYVMHAPFLTALRDVDGDGTAEERRDLVTGLGLPPEENPVRLHCANGVTMGHDGWLYLALGDHGCDVRREEGDRLVLQEGGILRCRPDGSGLHVFASGLRNIYDVALDDELNVFVRDNENDGGDYKIRVCHSFFGADHGYPYLYYERPGEALAPLADLGLGSSAGGLCYLETAFPAAYRGSLIFCEWGRAVVWYRRERRESGFAPVEEAELAAGAPNDPYGFKPTDLVVDRDGSLLVCDWADDQRPRRGRGRVYRISSTGNAAPAAEAAAPAGDLSRLDAESYHVRVEAQTALERRGQDGIAEVLRAIRDGRLGVRARLHAIWILARALAAAASTQPAGAEPKQRGGSEPGEAMEILFELARSDPEPRVRAQAVRALADLTDPVLARRRLDAGVGDRAVAARLAALAAGQGPRVVLEVVVALGRLRWEGSPGWLREHLRSPDPALAHAALRALRRSENRPAVIHLLDEPDGAPVRAVALGALGGLAEGDVVDGWTGRLRKEGDPRRRSEYVDALTRVHRKPGPWTYWGYRPAPRPANTASWERTAEIEQALDRVLADPDHGVRAAALRRMQRERIPVRTATLAAWLREEREAGTVAAILDSLRELPAAETRELLVGVVGEKAHGGAQRLAALEMLAAGGEEDGADRWLVLARAVEDGPVLARLLRLLGRRAAPDRVPLLVEKLGSREAEVRTAAVESLAALRAREAAAAVRRLLDDPDAAARRAAAAAAGTLGDREAIQRLLDLARETDLAVRGACLDSLGMLREPRALPLALEGLGQRETQPGALACLAEIGGPEQAGAVVRAAEGGRSIEVLRAAARALTAWREREPAASPRWADLDRAVAELQGASGTILRWSALGPLSPGAAAGWIEQVARPGAPPPEPAGGQPSWSTHLAELADSRITLAPAGEARADGVWLALSDVAVPEETAVKLWASSSGPLRVWLDGRPVHANESRREFQPGSDRFEATLAKGVNRLLVQVAAPRSQLHLGFRPKSSSAEKERLAELALAGKGDPARGRAAFFDLAKGQCVKCHRIGSEGGRVGPELTGVGSRFTRVHLIESILEPSRAIAPSFETSVVILDDGQVMTGVKLLDTEASLTLGDSEGQSRTLSRSAIVESRLEPTSIMPEGLEKQLTAGEFTDLVEFLLALKE